MQVKGRPSCYSSPLPSSLQLFLPAAPGSVWQVRPGHSAPSGLPPARMVNVVLREVATGRRSRNTDAHSHALPRSPHRRAVCCLRRHRRRRCSDRGCTPVRDVLHKVFRGGRWPGEWRPRPWGPQPGAEPGVIQVLTSHHMGGQRPHRGSPGARACREVGRCGRLVGGAEFSYNAMLGRLGGGCRRQPPALFCTSRPLAAPRPALTLLQGLI